MFGETSERIGVIKLGSLGDFVQALGPFRAIRRYHAAAQITLITTAPYVRLARASGYFDAVWMGGRPRDVGGLIKLLWRLRRARFGRVYDLQTSDRSSAYFWALAPFFPAWSGIVPFGSYAHRNAKRAEMHTLDRQAEQLALAGVPHPGPPDVSWVKANVAALDLPARFALLVPGGSTHRPAKRWPAAFYGALAASLAARGVTPLILGTGAERALAAEIQSHCPAARDLVDRTSFEEIVELGRRAEMAVGNDTGPMHLLAVSGAPCLVLFSQDSEPARCAPRGPKVEVLQVTELAALSPDDVIARLAAFTAAPRDAAAPA